MSEPLSVNNPKTYKWVVLNQTQTPTFQDLIESLSMDLGPCLILTGTPFPTSSSLIKIEKGPAYDRRSVLRRLQSWISFTLRALVLVVRLPGRPFILVVTNPPLLPHLAWAVHKLRRFPYAVLVWDVYPDCLVQSGILGRFNPVTMVWNWFNRRAMAAASRVITISQGIAGALAAQLGDLAPNRPIDVIHNWADTSVLHPKPKNTNPFACLHGQASKITVLFAGNMGQGHGLTPLVEAAALLKDEPRVSFLLVGEGLGRPEIENKIKVLSAANVKLLPYQPWEILPDMLATGDIAVVSQSPGYGRLSMPSRLYSMLAAGCAILACADPDSDLAGLVKKYQVGVTCPHDDAWAVAQAVRELAGDPERLGRCRERAREVCLRFFNLEVAVGRFRSVLASV